MIKTEIVYYEEGNISFEGFLAYEDSQTQSLPAVMVAHDWTGRNDFACNKAIALAKLGYVGFALDMFGDAKLGKNNEEKSALIQPLLNDRACLQRRINRALAEIKGNKRVNPNLIAAIGFCFGGLCVLDLARSGASVKGVISFHGLLMPADSSTRSFNAKVLALHGYSDPMVPPEHVFNFAKEMTDRKVDWQLHAYGNTMHAFTNPVANDPGFGTVYNNTAESRSWQAMQNFLTEIFN